MNLTDCYVIGTKRIIRRDCIRSSWHFKNLLYFQNFLFFEGESVKNSEKFFGRVSPAEGSNFLGEGNPDRLLLLPAGDVKVLFST